MSLSLLWSGVGLSATPNFKIEPSTNNGEKWRIGYYEGGEYAEDDFWWKGYLVRLAFSGKKPSSIELIPVSSGPDGSAVKLIEGSEQESFSSYLLVTNNRFLATNY